MLDQALQRFPGQVEPVELRVAALERGDDLERLGVVVEAAETGQALVERALAGMAEGRMAEIVGERHRLGQVLVEAERAGERTGDLHHFQGVGEPGAVVVALVVDENLRLVGKPAEGAGMDDAVAIAAEIVARGAYRLAMAAAAALPGIGRIGRARDGGFDRHGPCPAGIELVARRTYLVINGPANRMAAKMSEASITVSERAARRIGDILKAEPEGTMLRVSVEGGGCSGFQYKFDMERAVAADDLVIARDGATVLIDPVSQQYMAGSEIDFVEDLIGASFKVKNPNATASCGCGTSFAL